MAGRTLSLDTFIWQIALVFEHSPAYAVQLWNSCRIRIGHLHKGQSSRVQRLGKPQWLDPEALSHVKSRDQLWLYLLIVFLIVFVCFGLIQTQRESQISLREIIPETR